MKTSTIETNKELANTLESLTEKNKQYGLSEQELLRREKLKEIEAMGINPFPAPLFEITHTAKEIKEQFNESTKDAFANVSIAGRIMSVRDIGKANFALFQDAYGRIQAYIRKADIIPCKKKNQ